MTRAQLGNILSGNTPTRTIKSKTLEGTSWDNDDIELEENWLVTYLEVDSTGTLVIECAPRTTI